MKGHAGQWREEWAAVVRWAGALQEIRRESNAARLGRYAEGRSYAMQQALAQLGAAMGWPDWMRWRRR
jgi:hypothetical protein